MLQLNPKPLYLPWTMYTHRALASPRPGGQSACPTLGVPWAARAVCAHQQHLPAGLEEWGCLLLLPYQPPRGHWLGGIGAPPAPWGAPCLWLRAGTAAGGQQRRLERGTWSPGGNRSSLSHSPAAPAWTLKGAGGCRRLPQGRTGTLPNSGRQTPAAHSAHAAVEPSTVLQGHACASWAGRSGGAGAELASAGQRGGSPHCSAGAAGPGSGTRAAAAVSEHLPAAEHGEGTAGLCRWPG